jgi:hypothetical protein
MHYILFNIPHTPTSIYYSAPILRPAVTVLLCDVFNFFLLFSFVIKVCREKIYFVRCARCARGCFYEVLYWLWDMSRIC